MDNTPPILNLENVSIARGLQMILENINLTLSPGDYACIYGRSGSGKTSLLRTIALLEKPAHGRIMILGRDYTRASESEKSIARNKYIGYIPQQDNLIPQLTIRENILLPLAINKAPIEVMDERLRQVASQLEIQDLLDRYPHQLSGGQRRRAMIARALVKDPKLILADEPLAGLDDRLIEKALGIFKDLASKGKAVIHATPDSNEKPPCTKTYRIKGNHLIRHD